MTCPRSPGQQQPGVDLWPHLTLGFAVHSTYRTISGQASLLPPGAGQPSLPWPWQMIYGAGYQFCLKAQPPCRFRGFMTSGW